MKLKFGILLILLTGFYRMPASGKKRAVPGDALRVIRWEKREGVLRIVTTGGILQLRPYLDGILQVQFGSEKGISETIEYAVKKLPPPADVMEVEEAADVVVLKTKLYSVRIARSNSCMAIWNRFGKLLLRESPEGGRTGVLQDSVEIKDNFLLTADEALYGLGQYRDSVLNLRGRKRELVQFNTQVAIPVLLSTNGWGMFWDNPSRTVFSDSHQGMSFKSDVGSSVNFYVFVGAKLDDIIAGYRALTGDAPLLPEWAFGYHQSRNRYASEKELVGVVKRMRSEKIPMSSVFIDYFYWGKYGLGSHHFDEGFFPDPKAMIQSVHDYHTKVVVTVWPAFQSGSKNYDTLQQAGYLLQGVKALNGVVYDPFNPRAAAMYWKLISNQLVPLGIDGWFLDGPEPDNANSFLHATTFAGPAASVRNLYPLVHTRNFYNGLLTVHPNQRPYIITRSAWASQQHNGTVVWSGDIQSTFSELRKQITAGLNFVASGIPYWTTDIGGYEGGDPADSLYREIYTRWWQYGVFCPIFRSHGRRYPGTTKVSNELWAYGTKVQQICTDYSELRYRLLPYIYSLAGNVTQRQYTPMRLLAFDFAGDSLVKDIKDQFMYGPAFLVSPVTEAGKTCRNVYLPGGADWIDFWTGQRIKGGQTILADAPVERIPLYVRSGSIVPLGPAMQYTGEKPENPVELRIYQGADGFFELYEDDGQSFNYVKGDFSRIPFSWNESAQTLTIGARSGDYSSIGKHVFHIVPVGETTGHGIKETGPGGTIVYYSGKSITVSLAGK